MSRERRVINFAAGPAKLPLQVLIKAKKEMLIWDDSGMSVLELSHRSEEFLRILKSAQQLLRDLLHVPDNFKILFLQGGGTGQFAGIPYNLMKTGTADYLVTGDWSDKAAKEAEKYGKVNYVIPKTKKYTEIPDESTWNLSSNASYFYYCDNETIHGIECPFVPKIDGIPIVCDMSSNFLTREIDFSKFGLVYAGAQKNVGCAGLTIVIVRDDLIGHCRADCPTILDYKIQEANNCLYNTPPAYPIYISLLVFEWIQKKGGLEAMKSQSSDKAQLIYNAIDTSNGFYFSHIRKDCRSRMNIPFRVGGPEGNEDLEKKFLDEAKKLSMVQLKGHRSVGGIRASLYNAMSIEETKKLAYFMDDFYDENK